MKSLCSISPAKINLTLDVSPRKKEDAFHQIRTIYHKISLFDEIEIKEASFFQIEGVELMLEENLIYKAFELIHAYYPKEQLPSVKVKIKKNIPIQGGLAGGSSNFATFIKTYIALFELGPPPASLISSSAEYGKDIPFFLYDKSCALGENYGDFIRPVDFNFSGKEFYLFMPDFGCPTSEMYTSLQNYNTTYTEQFLEAPLLEKCGNAFNEFLYKPPYSTFIQNPEKFHLAGSGSSFFSFSPQSIEDIKPLELKLI